MHSTTFLLLFSSPLVAAYTHSDTKCSLPTQSVNYVAAPDVRGTLDILWSCLATILICTYSVLHLNVPEQRDGRDPGFYGNLKWAQKRFVNSVAWMGLTMVWPELYASSSFRKLRQALSLRREFKRRLPARYARLWSLSHMYFSDMGGFAVRILSCSSDSGTSIGQEDNGENQANGMYSRSQ